MSMHKALVAGITLLALGCGEGGSDLDLNEVSGTVTMDGQPLPDARVIFTPKGGGRPAYGMTDDSGNYTLQFTSTGEGAQAGEYIVMISTFIGPEQDPDTGLMTEPVPEKVPQTYVRNSTLTATVPSESYNFDLKSDAGEVVQPTLEEEE
jgi:hypothetical protein